MNVPQPDFGIEDTVIPSDTPVHDPIVCEPADQFTNEDRDLYKINMEVWLSSLLSETYYRRPV